MSGHSNDAAGERDAQLRRFQEAARELECDDDAERFDERVRRLARAPKTDGAEEVE